MKLMSNDNVSASLMQSGSSPMNADDIAALEAEIARLNALVVQKQSADAELAKAEADLGLMPTTSVVLPPGKSSMRLNSIAQRIASAAPPVQAGSTRFAERIAKEIANSKPKSIQAPVKTAVNDNYADILAGYRAGVSLVKIAEIMTEELGINIKHGSLRNYFMGAAKAKGDVKATKRGETK